MQDQGTTGEVATHAGGTPLHGRIDLRFGSNAVRLSGRQWAVAAAILLAAFIFTPGAWSRLEPWEPDADYRMPYDLSNDYWLFSRWSGRAASEGSTLVIGDSVVWGQYVLRDQTLSHYLSGRAGGTRFANLGLDGAHPVALAGLLQYYGGDIAGRSVLLHCNLLWTASRKHDLQTEKEFRFNHPDLVPQFIPSIPCYAETRDRRLGIVISRQVPFSAWANHLKLAYFDKMDLPTWSLANPYANPLDALLADPPAPQDQLLHEPVPWTERGIARQDFAWVDLDTSLQWRYFREAVGTLQRRGNRVFVLVGPFNEHLLTARSLALFAERKKQVETWLKDQGIPYLIPAALPSELYADASHPLADGYAELALRLLEDHSFSRFAAASAATAAGR